jgi:dipeptidyl aminopeptidase/acylaminoacyl peptidase
VKLFAAVAFLASFSATGALGAERVIDFQVDGLKVVGTLNVPDGASKPPVILLLHGFTGSRNELEIPAVKEGIFACAARMWAERGVASLRIDFRGSGESGGEFADTTLDGQIKDGLAALDYLAKLSEVDADKMSLVGWSMGGAVGSAVAARTDHDLKAVVLWAPGTNMGTSIAYSLGQDAVKKGLAAGANAVEARLPWGAKISLKGPFFQSLYAIDPVAEITRYDGPLMVAVGTKDDVVFPQPVSGQALLDYHDGDEELVVWPMDHVFNAFENAETVDKLIAETGKFIAKHSD